MKKRVMAAGFGVALLAALGLGVLIAAQGRVAGVETTQDIGARIGGPWSFGQIRDGAVIDPGQELKPASFVPQLGAERGIALAKKHLKYASPIVSWDVDAWNAPVRTTVGVFTGRPESGPSLVTDLKVRVVVVDRVPLPCLGPADCGLSRFSMLFDDATGEFVFGTTTGGVPR